MFLYSYKYLIIEFIFFNNFFQYIISLIFYFEIFMSNNRQVLAYL
jgi:hypothetical protein